MGEFNGWLIGGGAVIGALFGVVVQRYRFCLVAGVSNFLLIRDGRQMMAFAAALLVAVIGTQLLEMTGIVAIGESTYRNATLDWFGAGAGGLLFGVGATLSGGCAARTLVRTMEGSLHSLLALLSFSLSAAVVQFGFLEPYRLALTEATAIELGSDAGLVALLALPAWLVLAVIGVALALFVLRCWRRNPNPSMVMVGLTAGGLVVAGWLVTGVLAQDEFMPTPTSSMTVSGPLARFGYFLISGKLAEPTFAIAFVAATAASALLLALSSRQFHLQPPAKGMAKMAILGGGIMGVGAIMAYGCNVGQGMSGVSTLSLESLIAVTGIVSGIAATTRWLERRG